ncbi:MAG: hypothetical protein JWQ85_1744 [Mucilaginibacter sp.]|nr:hypothetical protein [Mucilaginibacter sp.]
MKVISDKQSIEFGFPYYIRQENSKQKYFLFKCFEMQSTFT